jgi:mRNA interferase YafQ
MPKPGYTHQFERELRRIKSSGRNLATLRLVMKDLAEGTPLAPIYDDHPLKGWLGGHRSCHPQGDLVLIYNVSGDEITFERLGTHSDIYGA